MPQGDRGPQKHIHERSECVSVVRDRLVALNRLCRLKHHERQRKMARNIKRVRNKLNQTATNQVCVTENGNRRLVTGKRDIENACIAENEARFSQFENTSPMTASLLTELGYLAETFAADSILNGT